MRPDHDRPIDRWRQYGAIPAQLAGVDCAAVASPSPHGGGAAADLADYDREAALARLSGHVASALKYVRERESSTGSISSTAVDDSPESLAESHRREKCAPSLKSQVVE